MCLLTYYPAGAEVDTTRLLAGSRTNNDGHGFAIVDGDRLIVQRSMVASTLIENFAAMRALHPDGPALFHSRFTTHGLTNVENCHPFTVGGDGRTVLAHNGIMPAVVQPAKGDHRSDTRITAEDFIPAAYGHLRKAKSRQRFARWMTTSNKAVLLTVDPTYQDNAYIFNESEGHWVDGVWYSNYGYVTYNYTSFMPVRGRKWSHRKGERQWWGDSKWIKTAQGTWRYVDSDAKGSTDDLSDDRFDDDTRETFRESSSVDMCWECHRGIPSWASECPNCGFCVDCLTSADACECYVVSSARAGLEDEIDDGQTYPAPYGSYPRPYTFPTTLGPGKARQERFAKSVDAMIDAWKDERQRDIDARRDGMTLTEFADAWDKRVAAGEYPEDPSDDQIAEIIADEAYAAEKAAIDEAADRAYTNDFSVEFDSTHKALVPYRYAVDRNPDAL